LKRADADSYFFHIQTSFLSIPLHFTEKQAKCQYLFSLFSCVWQKKVV
jgi:hypothetical protein